MIKVDLHVHSRASNKPAGFFSRKFGINESYSEPKKLYKLLKKRGMTHVTLTDHDTIDGCLEIAHLKNTFISEEITTFFPEDRCKIHVLAFDINERQHEDIQRNRENIYDLVDYLNSENILFSLAHPFYDMNGNLSKEHVEKFLLLFDSWEIYNGTRSMLSAELTKKIATRFTWTEIEKLANKHGFLKRRRENISFTGGSDDHGGLDAGKTFTTVENGETLNDLKEALLNGETKPCGIHGSPKRLTHTVMKIVYSGAKRKFNLGEFKHIFDLLFETKETESTKVSIAGFIKTGKSEQFIKKVVGDSYEVSKNNVHEKVFSFANSILPYAVNKLSKGNSITFSEFTSSLGLNILSLAPFLSYLTTYWHRAMEKKKAKELFEEMTGEVFNEGKIICFTDTYFEINGVARTYQKINHLAKEQNLNLKIALCDNREINDKHIINFKPLFSFPLPEYEEIPLNIPNLIEIVDYIERENFDVVYAATPGPVGIAAFIAAKLLNLPFVTTYHTDLPEYALKLTGDKMMKDVAWKLLSAFYNASAKTLSPSLHYKNVLIENGVKPEKIEVFKRGVDFEKFNPKFKDENFFGKFDPTYNGEKVILFVGRVSKEKEIDTFLEVARKLKHRKDLKFIIVGDGPYKKEAEAKAENVIFTGYLVGKELSTAFASSHLFLFPSTTETFGNVILEAYASGLPVLVSDKGASKENVIEGETGFVIKDNNIEKHCRLIEKLADDSFHYDLIRTGALNFVKKRDHKKLLLNVIEMMSLYKIKERKSIKLISAKERTAKV